MTNFFTSLARSAWNGLRRAAQWLSEHLSDMWAAHTQALETSAAYRKQVLVLSGAVLTMLAITGPVDAVLAASVATYVAAHVIDDGDQPRWNDRPAVMTRGYYDFDERPW